MKLKLLKYEILILLILNQISRYETVAFGHMEGFIECASMMVFKIMWYAVSTVPWLVAMG